MIVTSRPRTASRSASVTNLSRYEIPNELLQQFPQLQTPPGTNPQLQTAGNFETMGIASYQHIFSPNLLANLRGMVRDNSNDLNSNTGAWPIAAFLHNDFKEGYFNAAVSIHHGRHEWKAGLESDNFFLHENFSDVITANPGDPLISVRPGHSRGFRFHRQPPRPRTVRLHSGFDPPRQMDRQRRPSLGPLSAYSQSKRCQPAIFRRALFPRGKPDRPCLVRSRLSDAIVRKYSPGQFARRHRVEPQTSSASRSSLPMATTSNSVPPRASSISSASMPHISAAT